MQHNNENQPLDKMCFNQVMYIFSVRQMDQYLCLHHHHN